MARKPRFAPGGIAYHVMNRTWGSLDLFEDAGDYEAFERVLAEAVARPPVMRVCAYCLMPNHFHLVLWPHRDGQLSRFMQWLTMTHAQRWHAHRHTGGRGHLYQSRFRSFPIQEDGHFLSVCRYVERNPLRANLVAHAKDWRWSSLAVRQAVAAALPVKLAPWPMGVPRGWLRRVEAPQDEKELAALRLSRDRGRPYGEADWTRTMARRLGIESALRPPGRPWKNRKTAPEEDGRMTEPPE
jgi:putative transposase